MDHSTRQKSFMYLLERAGEPLYIGPRGHGNNQVIYNIPPEVLNEYETNALSSLRKRIPPGIEVNVININKTAIPYDLTPVQVIPRNAIFSYLNPVHQKAADALTKILMSQPNITEYFNACSLCRDVVNTYLWLHSFFSSAMRRHDMKGFVIPPVWEITPDLYIESKYLKEAHKQAAFALEDRAVIEVPLVFTGFNTDPEHRVAYFREDVGLNSFHWLYHLSNPFSAPKNSIDRQGELFYWVHHFILSRYNTERMTNSLNRVTPLYLNEGETIPEAYFSKLTLQNSGTRFASRQENSVVKDIVRLKDPLLASPIFVSDLRVWLDRIKEAIDAGFAISDDGKKINLRNDRGIDVISAMVEPTFSSVNLRYYGNAHANGHAVMAYIHDADYRYKEELAVIGIIQTACKDSIFYRWHYYMELVFQRQIETLPPYAASDFLQEGIAISKVEVHTPSLDVNNLLTFWMQTDVDLSRGMDFLRTDINNLGPIWARLTHLQHRDFEYKIYVKNTKGKNFEGNFRVFMAPMFDEQGDRLPFRDQRKLFFQMDKFNATLKPGDNLVVRKSTDSAVTIPWAQTFRKIERDQIIPPAPSNFCGCGWPHNLLVPKGKHEGLSCEVFVMITNWDEDRVDDPNAPTVSETQKLGCVEATVLCGSLGRKYPDARPMGFPFERLPAVDPVTNAIPATVENFAYPFPNMKNQVVKIFHRDVTVIREDGAPSTARVIKI